jgi:hypothetical protein
MMLTGESTEILETPHCFCYAYIIGIYHTNVYYTAPALQATTFDKLLAVIFLRKIQANSLFLYGNEFVQMQKVLKSAWKMGCHLIHRSTISEFAFVWFPPSNRV